MARRRSPRVLRVVDRVVTAVGAVLLLAVAGLSLPMAGLSAMRTESCSGACDQTLVGGAIVLLIGGTIAVTVVTMVAIGLLQDRVRFLWWIPIAGLALALVVVLASDGLIGIAVGA